MNYIYEHSKSVCPWKLDQILGKRKDSYCSNVTSDRYEPGQHLILGQGLLSHALLQQRGVARRPGCALMKAQLALISGLQFFSHGWIWCLDFQKEMQKMCFVCGGFFIL